MTVFCYETEVTLSLYQRLLGYLSGRQVVRQSLTSLGAVECKAQHLGSVDFIHVTMLVVAYIEDLVATDPSAFHQ